MNASTKEPLLILSFTLLIVVLGLIPPIVFPTLSVYITTQSMGVLLAGGVLGAKRGALAVIAFLLLVAFGLPVVAGGIGGLNLLTGQTGGFFIGWIAAAYTIGLLIERYWVRLNFITTVSIVATGAIGTVYITGLLWIVIAGSSSLTEAMTIVSIYIPGDIIKSVICALIVLAFKEHYPLITLQDTERKNS